MTHKPDIGARLVVAGGAAAINVAALALIVIADGGFHNSSWSSLVPFALVPTVLACGGVLLTRDSEASFVFASACCGGVCLFGILGIVEACGVLLQWRFSELGESAVWLWLFQIPLAVLTFLIGFLSTLFHLLCRQYAA